MLRNSRNVNCPSPPAHFCALGFQSPPQNPRPGAGGFVNLQAHAKINLYLDVVGKRPDGYHDIVSVMQSVGLCDDLHISCNGTQQLSMTCSDPSLPTDETNLVVMAARLLIDKYKIQHPVHIELTKRVPVGAGLAGGSSDCAATLRGINELFQLNISMDELVEIGRTLGADVPFCLMGGTALAQGIGERLTPLPPHPPCHIVLAMPGIHVATAEVYARLNLVKKSIAGHTSDTRGLSSLKNALANGDVSRIAASFYNAFTPITAGMHPEISDILTEFRVCGALGASMSGTGSAVFAYFDNENYARRACNRLSNYKFSNNGLKTYATSLTQPTQPYLGKE